MSEDIVFFLGQSAAYRSFTLRPSFSDTVSCELRVHVAIV